MSMPLLSSKIQLPPLRPRAVLRPRLIERLNEGLHGSLTLVSASAGYGKTTLISEWAAGCGRPVAWLSLDEEDNDPQRFLTYLCAAVQNIGVHVGEGIFAVIKSSPTPPLDSIVPSLLDKIAAADRFVLVLDDCHVLQDQPVNEILIRLLERLPPSMHLTISTREDPQILLGRLRARNQLTELRAPELRFTVAETADFLSRTMGLQLSPDNVALLESGTEGWAAGLQLAALSMRGQEDPTGLIASFTGSHRYVLDYLVEEVLTRLSPDVYTFLLHTSILDRMCGPLCAAILQTPPSSAQAALEHLERANLFVVPLDEQRQWYRYHHLFADLLRQRLRNTVSSSAENWAELHKRASEWFARHGLELEAFRHAVAARDVDRAAHLAEGEGMPLLFRGAVTPVLQWLESLPDEQLDAKISLRVMHASALLTVGRVAGVEPKLRAAEQALAKSGRDAEYRDVIGHIAAIRATLGVSRHEADTILAESRRALEYLHPDNLPVRTATTWALGYAYQLQGNRTAAGFAYDEALSASQKIGHFIIAMMAELGLGNVQEAENRLYAAEEIYREILRRAGDPPLPAACEAHLGLARLFYEWNGLDAAEQHGLRAAELAKRLERTDRAIAAEVQLAKIKLARGDANGAAALLARADHFARQQNYGAQIPSIAAEQVRVLLHEGHTAAAEELAQKHELRLSLARVRLAQNDPSGVLALLEPLQAEAETKGLADERLKLTVLQALAFHSHGDKRKAVQHIAASLAMAESGGFVRIFVDEGTPMHRLLRDAAAQGRMSSGIGKLLAVWEDREAVSDPRSGNKSAEPLIEPLSEREIEVLRLVAEGLSNREIGERLFIALPTVKGHIRTIFGKLQVRRRTEAVARAREWGLP